MNETKHITISNCTLKPQKGYLKRLLKKTPKLRSVHSVYCPETVGVFFPIFPKKTSHLSIHQLTKKYIHCYENKHFQLSYLCLCPCKYNKRTSSSSNYSLQTLKNSKEFTCHSTVWKKLK